MSVFVFSLGRNILQTIKIGAHFLCNSLLQRNKWLLTSAQVFCQFLWKLVQNEEDCSLTLKFYFFCKIFWGRCWNGRPLWGLFPTFFNAIDYDQTTIENSKLGTMYIFWGEILIFYNFSKIWKFNNLCDVIKSNLGQKGPNLHTVFELW